MPIEIDKVTYTMDVSDLLDGVPEEEREEAAYQAGETALQKIHEYMEKQTSPVAGEGKFAALKKDSPYRDYKRKTVGHTKPNLRLTGDLINGMEVDADENSFTISVDDENAGKAHNHNTGTTVVKRQFLPDDTNPDQQLKGRIKTAIKKTINRYKKKGEKAQTEEVPPDIIEAVGFEKLLQDFQATKREKQIAKNLGLFKIKDIL